MAVSAYLGSLLWVLFFYEPYYLWSVLGPLIFFWGLPPGFLGAEECHVLRVCSGQIELEEIEWGSV